MPLNFTFALSQQQTFELRCDYGSRRLDKTELAALIDLCEQTRSLLFRKSTMGCSVTHFLPTAI
ncbi:hypothetical protein [Nostoc sp.]|uniref:hypothetical protein n=1 Tax=Nostoc sp. TaxID=1180 RepID=UPI002FF86CD3